MNARHGRLAATAIVMAAALGACNGSAGGGGTPPPVALSSLTATAVPQATTAPVTTVGPSPTDIGGGAPATPAAVDPCTLLTTAEASAIMGKSLGDGVVTQLDPDVACTWKSGTSEVKLILAPPAPDAATAQAYWDAAKSQVPSGLKLNTINSFDRAAYANGSSAGVSVSALFVIQDKWFFDLFCGFPACGEAASVGGAEHIVGRLP